MNFHENIVLFDTYQVHEKLEESSVFSIYSGNNINTGEKVLIKLLNPDKFTRYEVDKICFANEISVIKTFENTNILKVLEAGSYSNTVCVVTEYVEMQYLSDYVAKRSSLAPDFALKIVAQLACALRYSHMRNILHRNIRLSNIYISVKDDVPTVKLFDYGMSYVIDYINSSIGQIDESFGYMAPESTGLLDRKDDSRSDLYSLGIILYRLLTGDLPFHADSIDNMVYQHVAVMPKVPEEINPTIPSSISRIVMKLIAKSPDLRYQTANELISDIDRYFASANGFSMPEDNLLQTMDQRSRLLCRKHELAEIRNLYPKAFESHGSFCLVSGSIGCGKSDLFTNLCTELGESNVPYFRVHFTSHGTMNPYSAFHTLLDRLCELFKEYDHKLRVTEGTRLAKSLSGCTDLITRICPALKSYLPASVTLPALEGYKEQQRSIMLLASFFLSMHSQGKPFVLIFDDIHHADAASLTLLNEIASQISNYNVFVICSYRENENSDSPFLQSFFTQLNEHTVYDHIKLTSFNESRMCEYLSDILLLDKSACQILATYMLEKTEGNPYFTVNVLRSMLEDGVISVCDGTLEQNWEQLRSITTGDDLSQIISRRMNILPEDAISFFSIASVVGSEFSLKLMMLITDLTRDVVMPWIDAAVALQFIDYSSSNETFVFSHNDIHDEFMSRLSAGHIKELHYWIGKGLEILYSDRQRNVYDLVYHFDCAGRTDESGKYIMEVARLAKLSNANEEAIAYYNKALEILKLSPEQNNPDWFEAKRELTSLNLTAGHYSEAIAAANDILPLLTDKVEKAAVMRCIGTGHFRQAHFAECEEALLTALKFLGINIPVAGHSLSSASFGFTSKLTRPDKFFIANASSHSGSIASSPTDESVIYIYLTLCGIYIYTDLRKFDYIVMRMCSYTRKHIKYSKELACTASVLSLYYAVHHNERKSNDMQLLALKIRRELGDDIGAAMSLYLNGVTTQWRSQLEKSTKNLREAIEIFTSIGDLWQINNANLTLAQTLLMDGNYAECQRICEDTIAASSKLNDSFTQSLTYAILTECFTEMGDYPNAMDVIRTSASYISNLNIPYVTAWYNFAHGRLMLEQLKYKEAENFLSEAVKIIENNDIVAEYLAAARGYLAIAKIHHLEKYRGSISVAEAQNEELALGDLTDCAVSESKNLRYVQLVAYRASALYYVLLRKGARAERFFEAGAKLASVCEYHFECALLYYEYGQFLLSKHKTNQARYYTFEAYMTFSNISSTLYMKACETIISEKYQEAFHNNKLLADITARRNRMNVDRKVNTLLRLGDRLTSTLELEELQKKILQDAIELVGAERGILFLYPESGDKRLYVASVYNLGNFDCNTYDWMLKEVEASKKPIVINDVQSDEYRKHYTVMVRYGIKSVMAMPMFVRGNLFGVIYLDSRLVRQIFSADYIDAISFIANQAGAPIENARLYHRAITDGLTGIYGRSYLDNLIIDKISEPDPKLAAIMIDVDNFKSFNDTYGHPFGDKVLKQIASIMKRVSNDCGTPCRYGGEEFVVILNSNDPGFALSIANKIRQTVESTTLAYNDGSNVKLVSVSISLGISVWDPSMERVDLIEHADKALYYAKQHGKNRADLWTPSLPC